jgi:hypothetical protein
MVTVVSAQVRRIPRIINCLAVTLEISRFFPFIPERQYSFFLMDDTALLAIARVEHDGRNVSVRFDAGSLPGGGQPSMNGYSGQLLDNLRHGDGQLTLSDGTTVAGSFDRGVLHGGRATVARPDGATFRGTVERGQRQGFGVFQRAGASYSGDWAAGMREGRVSGTAALDPHDQRVARARMTRWRLLRVVPAAGRPKVCGRQRV